MSSKLISRLSDFIATQTEEPSKKDLSDALKEVYKSKKTKKSNDEGDDKQKRKPSAYNIYYSEQSAIIKQREETIPKDERMTAKEKMSYIAKLWKEQKSAEKSEDDSEITAAPVEEKPAAKKQSSKSLKDKNSDDKSEDDSEITPAPVPEQPAAKKQVAKTTTSKKGK
jgi:hypothetical protein